MANETETVMKEEMAKENGEGEFEEYNVKQDDYHAEPSHGR